MTRWYLKSGVIAKSIAPFDRLGEIPIAVAAI
jgi:hypothetical protein